MIDQVSDSIQVVGFFVCVFTVGLNYTTLTISLHKLHISDSIRATRVYPEINIMW